MAEHMIETRILLRYDTLENWMSSTVILKQGEAAIAAAPFNYTIEDTNHRPSHTPPAVGIKIGDGFHYFSELPWVQGVAGDVYSWAKQQTKPTYTADEIQGLSTLVQQYINNLNPGQGSGGGDVTVEARSYRLSAGTGNNANKYYLQSKGPNDAEWITDELNFIDLSTFAAVLDWLGNVTDDYWNINGYTIAKVNERLALLDYTDTEDISQVVTAVNQNDGRISVTRRPLSAENISGVLPVEHGGTGRVAFDYDSVLIGNGTNSISTKPIDSVLTNNNNLATNRAIIAYITNVTAGLTGAMHYIGEATVEITNGTVVNPRIDGYNFSNALAGDVITFNHAEFVWNGSSWRLLGDEGSYAIKGSITDRDIAEDANIDQSKINNLVVDLNSKVDKIEGKGLSTNDYTTEEKQKLNGIEDNAQRNIIEHVYINGSEVLPTIVDGKENTLSLRVSALTPEEEEKIAGLEAHAQVNRIEHIFLNEEELPIGVIKNQTKSVNISINEFTTAEKEKLSDIETGAQVNIIERIFFNETEITPNNAKELHVTLDDAVLNLQVLKGAQVPNGNSVDEVPISVQKKLQLARIAMTGNVSDLLQTIDTYIVLDCGSSTDVI